MSKNLQLLFVIETSEVEKKTRQYNHGITKIIYVFDKDKDAQNYSDTQFNIKVKKYCELKKYNLIWFVPNIEFVFLGKNINKTEKKRMANKFLSEKGIKDVDIKKLNFPDPGQKGSSNILTILDSLLSELKK